MNPLKWDNLNLEQIRQLGVWLKWAEFWAEHQHGKDKPFADWPKEAEKLAQTQSELRFLYEKKMGAPPHIHDVCMYSPQAAPPPDVPFGMQCCRGLTTSPVILSNVSGETGVAFEGSIPFPPIG